VVLAWSLGALLALEAMVEHPALVDAAVLVCATPCFCRRAGFRWGAGRETVARMTDDVRADARGALARFAAMCAAPHATGEDKRLDPASMPGDVPGVGGLLGGLRYLESTDLRGRLDEVTSPALVLHGRADRVVPWRAGRYLAVHLPDARWRAFRGVGHDLPVRAPEAVADEVRPFLKELL
jgi:pimeloyl-[acyl-carrier protein] methyl ester esterase